MTGDRHVPLIMITIHRIAPDGGSAGGIREPGPLRDMFHGGGIDALPIRLGR